MQVSIPYHRQDTSYTCGPASLQMLLHHFNGVYPSESELARRLHTSNKAERDGTSHSELIRVLREEGLNVYVDNEASFGTLEAILKIGVPALVHYIEPEGDVGHYAVAVGIDTQRVYLNDPWHGSGFSLLREEFLDRWHDGKGVFTRWLLAASPEPIFSGAHYSPK